MNTIYFTIETETTGNSQDGFNLTGNTKITLYEVQDGKVVQIDEFDSEIELNAQEEVRTHLEDNYYNSGGHSINPDELILILL